MTDTDLDASSDARFFDSRPERRKPCIHCGSTGWTGDPYALRPVRPGTAIEPPDAPPGSIHALVAGASHISEATREASEIARRAGRPVAFRFLSRTVVVGPDDDPDRVMRDWWIAHYGRTPEESAATR